jgi:AcrR family transcriptional regulator
VKTSRARKEAERGSVQERIINAAITCIERDGLRGATIRGIGREAGVNSAAISYYFRSKDALLEKALAQTLENAFGDWEALLTEKSQDLRPRVRVVLRELMEGSFAFPGLVKAHLYETFVNGAGGTVFLKRFAKFFSFMTKQMAEMSPEKSVREIARDAVQLVSAVFLPGIMPQLFLGAPGVDLSRPRGRAAYVDSLVGRFFPIAPHAHTV